jgi:rod shape determining protein RodA
MKRAFNVWNNLDWFTVLIYLTLVIIGWINIYAAVYSDEHQHIFDFQMRYGKQMIWIMAAFFLAIVALVIDIRIYSFFAYPVYVATILLLITVVFLGKEVNGARSWFELGGLRIQPTEFAKTATCLALAKYLSSFEVRIDKVKTIMTVLLIIAVPSLFIVLQPDVGSLLVFVTFAFVLYREGMPGGFLFFGFLLAFLFIFALIAQPLTVLIVILLIAVAAFFLLNKGVKETIIAIVSIVALYFLVLLISRLFHLKLSYYYILLIASGIAGIAALVYQFFRKVPYAFWVGVMMFVAIGFTYSIDFVFNNIMETHQKQRVNILLGKESDPRGAEYNVNQSKIAIGSGGFLGKGFLQGTQTKYNFVPEQSTDFIFCTVGEEWGFIGSFIVLVLFGLLLVRIIYLSERQRSAFSRIYGYGVASILFFHVFINVGMAIGLLPVIGIPLPFFSYGGSSLWSFTLLLFIFLRLDAGRLELFH